MKFNSTKGKYSTEPRKLQVRNMYMYEIAAHYYRNGIELFGNLGNVHFKREVLCSLAFLDGHTK